MIPKPQQQQLLTIARQSIQSGLNSGKSLAVKPDEFPPPLREKRATFVTLHIGASLRGCIGTTHAIAPLVISVADNAYSAAFRDPRFKPLNNEEFDKVHIDISMLTPNEPITFASEKELLQQIRPGVDGLIIEQGARKATFLPSVWESLPKPEAFLQHLKMKAGIAADKPPEKAWRYQAECIEEPEQIN